MLFRMTPKASPIRGLSAMGQLSRAAASMLVALAAFSCGRESSGGGYRDVKADWSNIRRPADRIVGIAMPRTVAHADCRIVDLQNAGGAENIVRQCGGMTGDSIYYIDTDSAGTLIVAGMQLVVPGARARQIVDSISQALSSRYGDRSVCEAAARDGQSGITAQGRWHVGNRTLQLVLRVPETGSDVVGARLNLESASASSTCGRVVGYLLRS
jgi:hypothetical protein